MEKLDDLHVEAFVSPMHDHDLNADGTPKKPHWHVMVMFPSLKTRAQADGIRELIGAVPVFQVAASMKGSARYLIHLDNPEKHQYDRADVRELGGADFAAAIRRDSDGILAVSEMIDYIEEHDVIWFSDFLKWTKDNKPEWFEQMVTKRMNVMYSYVKARGQKRKSEQMAMLRNGSFGRNRKPRPDSEIVIDEETGEVVDDGSAGEETEPPDEV